MGLDKSDILKDIEHISHGIERCGQRGSRMLSLVDLIEAGTIPLELAAIQEKFKSRLRLAFATRWRAIYLSYLPQPDFANIMISCNERWVITNNNKSYPT